LLINRILWSNIPTNLLTAIVFNTDHSIVGGKAGHWLDTDERIGIFMAVVVGTFEQNGMGIQIPELQVNTHRGKGIGKDFLYADLYINFFHSLYFYSRLCWVMVDFRK
jgi:hypothetical protein